jgi:hypothetical protein
MTADKLYTLLLEYQGGTYISQVSGASPAAALPKWVSEISAENLTEWRITRNDLAAITKSDGLVPIDGCYGVWCVSGSTKDGLVLINVISTDGS